MSQVPHPKAYTNLTIIVCIVSAAIGAFFGLIYGIPGLCVAAIGGAFAALLWSYMMLKATRKGHTGANLVRKGVLWGIIAGVADTLLLHIVGIILTGADVTGIGIVLSIAIICGVVAGAINGLICGAVWDAVAKKYPLSPASQE